MSCIMCTRELWRALGHTVPPPRRAAKRPLSGAVLGSWAVHVFRYDRQALALAVDERTFLTVMFPVDPPAEFRHSFSAAFRWALEDLGIGEELAEQEAAVIDFLPFARVSRPMRRSLKFLDFFVQCEFDYTDDLRRVQRNLNDVPHPNRPPYVPLEAVREVFARAAAPAALRVH